MRGDARGRKFPLLLLGALAVILLFGVAAWFTVGYVSPRAFDGGSADAGGVPRFPPSVLDDPSRAPARCQPDQSTLFSALAAHLRDREDSFADARFAYQDNDGLTYLSASVLDGGGVVSAATPVWVYGGAGFATLSESAARASAQLPDGRARYGVDPAGAAATRVQACVTAAAAGASATGN